MSKEFIDKSIAPSTLPILFIHKLGGSLCFYVNYKKLNVIIKKDRYPLPLIETLA